MNEPTHPPETTDTAVIHFRAKVDRDKRLTLLFPPLTMPTSPPLGMAMLKAYIERELPQWQVTILDLNLWCFRYLIEGIVKRQIGLSAALLERIGGSPDDLLRAAAVFTGFDDETFYRNPSLYDQYAALFLRFTEAFSEVLKTECDQWERQGRLSPLLKEMADKISATQPDMVGVSMIFSDQLPIGAMLGRYVREQLGRRVIFGGSCFTEGVESFMKWYPGAADVIVSGDGELPLKALLQSGGDATGIAGTYRREEHGVVHEPAVFEKQIDSFGEPDFGTSPLKNYFSPKPVLPLLLSRGCYWRKCTFCVHYFSAGDTYRLHSLDHVIHLLTRMVERGVRHFSFVDEMIAPGHFVRLARAIQKAGLDISYYALSKPNKTFTPEILAEMAASGCKYILWGLESGNQRLLDLMGKGTEVNEVAEVLRDASRAGIHNHVYVICGFPTETPQEFQDTLRFLERNQEYISAIHRSTFSLEPGSPISKDLEKFSIEEVWLRQDTPLGGRLGYRCRSGMTMEEAVLQFRSALPFFRSFNPYAQHLANFRDHALLIYDEWGTRLTPSQKKRTSAAVPA